MRKRKQQRHSGMGGETETCREERKRTEPMCKHSHSRSSLAAVWHGAPMVLRRKVLEPLSTSGFARAINL